jgi:hypothetical protein
MRHAATSRIKKTIPNRAPPQARIGQRGIGYVLTKSAAKDVHDVEF